MGFLINLGSTIQRGPLMDGDGGTGGGGEGGFLGLKDDPIKSFKDVHPFDDPAPTAPTNPEPAQPTTNNEPPPASSEPEPPKSTGTEPQPQPLLLGKFKDSESLSTAYLNLQSHSTKVSQEKAQLTETVQKLTQEMDNLRKLSAAPPASSEPKPEDVAKMSDERLELMYNNPLEYERLLKNDLMGEFKKELEPMLKPALDLQAQEENKVAWTNKAIEVAGKYDPNTGELMYPDFFNLQAELGKAFELFPQFEQNKDFEGAIKVARLTKVQTNTPEPPKPEELLNDKDFVEKNILNNPQFKEQFLKAHMEEISKGAPPPTINSSTPGSAPAAPVEKAKTLREASKRIASRLFGS